MHRGVYLEVVDYDRLYESVANEAILLNDYDMKDEEQQKILDKLLYTEYEGDNIETAPSCDCGHYNKKLHEDLICPECNTRCMAFYNKPMRSVLWAKVPDSVLGFVQPNALMILNHKFKLNKVELFSWLMDPSYKVPKGSVFPDSDFVKDLRTDLNWKRSLNELISRFDEVMDYIFSYKPMLIKGKLRLQLQRFIAENKHKFFPKYLPIPNKAFFIVERTKSRGVSLDRVIHSALDACRSITSMNNTYIEPTQQVKENRTVGISHMMAEFYAGYDKDNLSQKPGIFRKQIFGGRFDFSGRAVITSIHEPHGAREIHFPWGLSVLMLKTLIDAKLLARGFTPIEASKIVNIGVKRYDPLLDEIMQELIDEAPDNTLKTLFQRNPTLKHGSAQQLDLCKIKKDVTDPSISLSVLVLSEFNADFDGDEMNAKLNVDQTERDYFSRLSPHLNVMNTSRPFDVSGIIALPKPTVATIANWLRRSDAKVFNE